MVLVAQEITLDVRPGWFFEQGRGPLVAAALHAGHDLRSELVSHLAISEAERFREEDPFADYWTEACSNRLLVQRSRFEVDLNRPRDQAIYRAANDAWGLSVWKWPLPRAVVDRSLAEYDRFYRDVAAYLEDLEERHGYFVVLDFHSYNYRRAGRDVPPEDPARTPDINIGTGSMDRGRWAPIVDRLIRDLSTYDFQGRRLDVRENINFRGGAFPAFVHSRFPETGCCVAIEVKKFFMDEWTGTVDREQVEAILNAFRGAMPGLLQEWTWL